MMKYTYQTVALYLIHTILAVWGLMSANSDTVGHAAGISTLSVTPPNHSPTKKYIWPPSEHERESEAQTGLLDFLDTWVAGGLGLGGLGLGVGLGLPQAPQSPCEFVSVGHVWTPIST
jgi:hypothetical protein